MIVDSDLGCAPAIDQSMMATGHRGIVTVQAAAPSSYVQQGFYCKALLKNVSNDVDHLGLVLEPKRKALSTRLQIPNLPPLLVPATLSEYLSVRVSFVESARSCFVQLEHNAHNIIWMSAKIAKIVERTRRRVCNPEAGAILLAKYQVDNCYYRVCVVSKIGIDILSVYFIDYGNVETINITDLLVLSDPELLSVPPQAIFLLLSDVQHPKLVRDQISQLLSNQSVSAQIMGVTQDEQAFLAKIVMKDVKGTLIDLSDVLRGEIPAPVLPQPAAINVDDHQLDLYEAGSTYCSNNFPPSSTGRFVGGRSDDQITASDGPRRMRNYDDVPEPRRMQSYNNDAREPRKVPNYGGDVPEPRRMPNYNDDAREPRRVPNYGDDAREPRRVPNYNNDAREPRRMQSYNDDAREPRRMQSYNDDAREPRRPRNYDDGDAREPRRPRNYDDGDAREPRRPRNYDDGDAREPRKFGTLTCYNCHQPGHMSRDCTEPRSADGGRGRNWRGENNFERDTGEHHRTRQSSERNSTNFNNPKFLDRVVTDGPEVGEKNGWKTGDWSVSTSSKSASPIKRIEITKIDAPDLSGVKFGELIDGERSDALECADPFSFYVQLHRDEDSIAELLISELPKDLTKLTVFEKSRACMALFATDYFRAEIVDVADETCTVFFVDYGNVETVEKCDLYVINDLLPEIFRTAKQLAFRCRLHDVMPTAGKHEFDENAKRVFSELACEPLKICMMNQSASGVYDILLQSVDGGISIGDRLCARGHAVPFNLGDGPSALAYKECMCVRSDDIENVQPEFTVNLSENSEILDELSSSVVNCKKNVECVRIGDLAIVEFDECLYRAQVIADENDGDERTYRIRYVDFGNENVVTRAKLLYFDRDEQMPQLVYTARQGIRCSLEGAQPFGGFNGLNWSNDAQECLNRVLEPGAQFTTIFGHSRASGIRPLKIMIEKKVLLDNQSDGNEEEEELVNLASWMVQKGYAQANMHIDTFAVNNLLASGQHEYQMRVLAVDGQAIRARPCCYDEAYVRLEEAIHSVSLGELEPGVRAGLTVVGEIYKRAEMVEADDVTDQKKNKYLLVDDGTFVENAMRLFGTTNLDEADGFFVRTCHKLAVELSFSNMMLAADCSSAVLDAVGAGAVTVTLDEKTMKNGYKISGITLSDGRSLNEYLIANGYAKLVETEKSEVSSRDISAETVVVKDENDSKLNASLTSNENMKSSLVESSVYNGPSLNCEVPASIAKVCNDQNVSNEVDSEIQETMNSLVSNATLIS